jgi:N-acetylmuramoyl-L-alanine amidase
MKFGIDIGHNCPPDTGANGLPGGKREDVLTKEVGDKVIAKLQSLGHQVVNCTPSSASSESDSLHKRANKANSTGVDCFASIHFNSFNGQARGTEVFAASTQGKAIAQRVLNNIVGLGFVNRGVKNGSHYFVLRHTNMPAILIECCFCDSATDMSHYNTIRANKIADAIVQGLV